MTLSGWEEEEVGPNAAGPLILEGVQPSEPGAFGSTTHAALLPSGVAAGNLIVIIAAVQTNITVTDPDGFTLLHSSSFSSSTSGVMLVVWYKFATGSEGGSVTFGTSASRYTSIISYRFSGTTPAPTIAVASGNGTAPNPPSLTSTRKIWLAAAVNRRGDLGTVSSIPSSYTSDADLVTPGSCNSVRCTTTSRALEAGSEDPGAFALGSAQDWLAATIGIG